ncbi:MAG: polysaccharide lyase family 7 protein [Sandaracinaceae bacterium]|nr:polysaccharide lyase family 7 protein [Sandaracinaceae bacterium]
MRSWTAPTTLPGRRAHTKTRSLRRLGSAALGLALAACDAPAVSDDASRDASDAGHTIDAPTGDAGALDAAGAQDAGNADAPAIALDASSSDGGPSSDALSDAARPVAIDLSIWKLTLPIGTPGSPLEITQPELATYEIDPWFVRLPEGLRFRANAGGVTTSGSSYPRSELREMEPGGSVRASWSTTSGRHEMRLEETITHLPDVKPHVVAGQIHDASDDVIMIRLEGVHLFVEGGGVELGTLDADYALGERFVVRIVAEGGHIRVDHGDDGRVEVDVARDAAGCYFKAGVYTQSNTSRGDLPEAYGEVIVHAVEVTHGP